MNTNSDINSTTHLLSLPELAKAQYLASLKAGGTGLVTKQQYPADKYDWSFQNAEPTDARGISKKLFADTKALEREAFKAMREAGVEFKRMSNEEVMFAYRLVLDGLTVNEALRSTEKEFKWAEGHLDIVRNKRNKSGMRKALAVNESHPVQSRMTEEGLMTRSDKADLIQSTTSSALNKVRKRADFIARFEAMEKKQAEMEKRMAEMEARLATVEDHTVINPTSKAHAMQIAAKMKADGATQKEIAVAVGKGIATIKRWWKDI